MSLDRAERAFERGAYRDALELYKEVAGQTGSAFAQFQIGWIYQNGLGVEQSCAQAARWWTFSAGGGNITAANNLYSIYITGCEGVDANPSQALRFLRQAAQGGSARAQANLAGEYASGNNIDKDPFSAYDFARRSAEQDDVLGMLRLAEFHREGVGVPVDPERAIALLERAASMDVGHWDRVNKQSAQYNLGQMFDAGEGVPRDIHQAIAWFSLAASGPNDWFANEARARLEVLRSQLSPTELAQIASEIRRGQSATQIATTEDLHEALNAHVDAGREDAAISLAIDLGQRGDSYGQSMLGLFYMAGYGSIEKDLDEAYILFLRACRQGFWEACVFQAMTLAEQGRSKEALSIVDRMYLEMPQRDDARLLMVDALIILDDYVRAEELVREVLIADPINQEAKEKLQEILEISN